MLNIHGAVYCMYRIYIKSCQISTVAHFFTPPTALSSLWCTRGSPTILPNVVNKCVIFMYYHKLCKLAVVSYEYSFHRLNLVSCTMSNRAMGGRPGISALTTQLTIWLSRTLALVGIFFPPSIHMSVLDVFS